MSVGTVFGGVKYWESVNSDLEGGEGKRPDDQEEPILEETDGGFLLYEKKLDELSNPESFEDRLRSNLQEAEEVMDFSDSSLDTRSEVGLLVGELGDEPINKEDVEKAKQMAGEARTILERIKSLDLSKFSVDAARGIKKFLKEKWINLTPLLIAPIAAITGGDMRAAAMASIELTAGLYAMQEVLDSFMANAEEVVPPQYLIALIAGTTNLPELGASQASALAGDALSEVGATPLGSNPANLYLTMFAFGGALRERAEQEQLIEKGGKMSIDVYREVFKRIDWSSARKEFGKAGMFAIDALLFQFLVRPEMKKGNMAPLGVWLVANTPLLIEYFRRTTFSKDAKWNAITGGIGNKQVDMMREEIFEGEDSDEEASPGTFLYLVSLIELYKSDDVQEKEHKKAIRTEMEETFEKLRDEIVNDPDFSDKIGKILGQAKMKDVEALFKIASVDVNKKKVDKKKVAKMIAGMVAIVGLSSVLDMGVTNLAQAFPSLEKGPAGFFIMSLLTSLPELLTTKAMFEQMNDKGAVKNIADSNAINVSLSGGALATSAIRGII